MKKLQLCVALLLLLAVAGCSLGFNSFKQLGVGKKGVPAYETDGELTDKNPPTQIWATVKLKEATETQARQVAADYFSKKLKETPDLKYISLILKTKDTEYKGEYFKDEEAAKTAKLKENPEKFPAIVFTAKTT